MPPSLKVPLALLAILSGFLHGNFTFAQCGPNIPEPNCGDPSAIELFEGATVAAGQTYIVSSPLNINNFTMNGGQLIVCSILNVDLIAFNSGSIYVCSGGVMNMLNTGIAMVMGANSAIYNFGSINTNASIVTGANNLIYNCLISSVLNLPFNQLVVQGAGAQVINNGTIVSSFIINQSNNTVSPFCLGPGSNTTTGIMINNYPVGFEAPNGNACIHIYSMIFNSQTMADSSNVLICFQAGSVSIFGDPLFGNATVDQNCPGCFLLLGERSLELRSYYLGGVVQLEWYTDAPGDFEVYEIERSNELGEFEPLSLCSKDNLSGDNWLYFIDHTVSPGRAYYYRVHGYTTDEAKVTSNATYLKTFPQSCQTAFHQTDDGQLMILHPSVKVHQVFDMQGRNLPFTQHGQRLSFQSLKDQYIFLVYERQHEFFTQKLFLH